nr:hypothetical protein [Tanacetum cinerariifolium]
MLKPNLPEHAHLQTKVHVGDANFIVVQVNHKGTLGLSMLTCKPSALVNDGVKVSLLGVWVALFMIVIIFEARKFTHLLSNLCNQGALGIRL